MENSRSSIDERFENMFIQDRNTKLVPFASETDLSRSDFQVIEVCGKGAYAKVIKAMCLRSKEVKAIKIVDKSFIEKVGSIDI